MRKKLFVGWLGLFTVLFGLGACSGDSRDSDAKVERITRADIVNEGPITSKDIDVYLRILPELAPVVKNGPEAAKVYKKYNLSRSRFFYLFTKILICAHPRGQEAFNLDDMAPSIHPTEPEIELVRQNWEAISAAESDFIQRSGYTRFNMDAPDK